MFPWSFFPSFNDNPTTNGFPLQRWDPFAEASRMMQHMDGMFRMLMEPPGFMNNRGFEIMNSVPTAVESNGNFRVALDVKDYRPEEIKVTTLQDRVIIEGRQEASRGDHGFFARQFTRSYMFPRGVMPQDVTSSLSADGMLTIEARGQGSIEDVTSAPSRRRRNARDLVLSEPTIYY
ncbi:small heat shock protein [Trichuris trichiura]|uniref:Small heat shock protein n=1 Tax=Trichuris trichiura TaxID=36087 RepID=A0A077Z4L2_TRITR|nr:small heat shock protein [Trichuris trichiura]